MKPTQQPKETANGDVFDVQKVRRFAQIMKDYDLHELELQDGEIHIRLSRGGAPVYVPGMAAGAQASALTAVPAAASAPAAAPAQAPAEEKPAEDKNIQLITSPIVGTYYSKPNPTSPSFVNVGDVISEGKTVCIIEAMKVMNQLPAEISGKIVAILVKDGDSVEYGQPLFKVDVRG